MEIGQDVQEMEDRRQKSLETKLLKNGMSEEVLAKLLDAATTREEVIGIAAEFNGKQEKLEGLPTKDSIVLENGREIKFAWDSKGRMLLGYGFSSEK